MYTNTDIPAAFASAIGAASARGALACGHVSPWATPVQGIRMSAALGMDVNRDKQDATGYPAFEDPL